MAGKKDARFRKNRRFVGAVFIMLCCGVFFNHCRLQNTLDNQEKEISTLNNEIKKENKMQETLKERRADMNSKEFIEREAREKLGLAYPDEILFFSDTE